MSCKVYDFLVKKSYNKQELTYIIVINGLAKVNRRSSSGVAAFVSEPKKKNW